VSLPALIAILLGVSLTAYALFAGADFGAGILDLLAGSRDAERGAIAATIGPVWEANHVWLIFSITLLFSAFPAAFSALGTALLAPLTIALLAIVLRSAALGLRASPGTPARARAMLSRLFGAASLLAPFMFGIVAGALAAVSSSPRPGASPVPHIPWTGAFALTTGGLAVALCAQLAAGFVALGAVRSGEPRLAEHFRTRGVQSGACVLLFALASPLVAAATAPAVWHRLIGPALPLVLVGLGAGAMSLLATWRRRYLLARAASLSTGAAILWGWFVSQAPRLIGPHLTIHSAAATPAALVSIAIAAGVVLLLVLPAMYLLFNVFARPELEVIE
jgi:cytochrome bd ubiquinol oxidase subunit II